MTIIDNNESPKPTGGGQPRSKLSIAVAKAAAELEASKSKKERRETALAAMLAADATPPPEPEEGTNFDVCIAEDDNNFPAAKNPPSDILQIRNGQEEQDIEEGVSNILKITVTKEQSPDDKLGFKYVQEPSTGRYFITSVSADGLCGQTGLQKGQEMLEINGISLRGMEKEGVRNLLSSKTRRVTDVTITVTSTTQNIDIIPSDAVPTNITRDIDIIRSDDDDANLDEVQMISSKDGVTISRAMPSILANHMPATYWNHFCDELDELLVPVVDAKKLLIWLDVFNWALPLLVAICGVLFGLIITLIAIAAFAVIVTPVYNRIVNEVMADVQKISNGMKVKISRVTTQYPAIVLKVTPFDEEVGRRIKRVYILHGTNIVFRNLDYIEVSINRFGRHHTIENAVATRRAPDNPSAHLEEEMFNTEITEWWKHRRAKIFLICCISISVLAIGLGVGLGVAFSRQPPASASTSTVTTVVVIGTAAPSTSLSPSQAPSLSLSPSQAPSLSSSPSQSPSQSPTDYECFANRVELKAAVDMYVSSGCNEGANVCLDITSKYGWPMNSWCVGQVTDMSRLFSNGRVSIFSDFNDDISSWDVSQVQNMNRMFQYASSFNGDLSLWNVSQVQDMRRMFSTASSFNGDLSLWDVSQVQSMSAMFAGASSFNQDISFWNVSQVQDMAEMFYFASSFNQDVSLWDTSRVQDMEYMFGYASSFNQNLCAWADKNFPYNNAWMIFKNSGCTYNNPGTPQNQGGPFCASKCN